MSGAASSRWGTRPGVSALLIVLTVVAALLWPFLGLLLALVAIAHAHVAGQKTLRNVLVVLVVVVSAGLLMFGVGGSVEGGDFGV